ncbi:MAG TPA: hypothetical protein DFR83_01150 [Deltaproteobacteria bacterium]|nr:hypothetical protein [Deltaproteobacteria bacterium]
MPHLIQPRVSDGRGLAAHETGMPPELGGWRSDTPARATQHFKDSMQRSITPNLAAAFETGMAVRAFGALEREG